MIQGYYHKIFRWYRWLNSRNIRPHLRKKNFKLLKYFKIYSNLSSPSATSYSVQNVVFNNLPEALTSAKAALFDSGVGGGGGGGVSPYHRLLGIYTKVIRMFSWTNLHPSPLVYSWALVQQQMQFRYFQNWISTNLGCFLKSVECYERFVAFLQQIKPRRDISITSQVTKCSSFQQTQYFLW